jgi:hypothetical protein
MGQATTVQTPYDPLAVSTTSPATIDTAASTESTNDPSRSAARYAAAALQ